MANGRVVMGRCGATHLDIGNACVTHLQCASGRCDNRKGAGCVALDGGAPANGLCTTHQQCSNGCCPGVSQDANGIVTPGRCTSEQGIALGRTCQCDNQCTSGHCDGRAGAGCIPPDHQGQPGEFCTAGSQCLSGDCVNKIGNRGICSERLLGANESCTAASQCASGNCKDGKCADLAQQACGGKSPQYYWYCADCGGYKYGIEGWACSADEAEADAKRRYANCAVSSGPCPR
jgi:hypothetical protein